MKMLEFLAENFHVLLVKFPVYVNMPVFFFVMTRFSAQVVFLSTERSKTVLLLQFFFFRASVCGFICNDCLSLFVPYLTFV